MMITAASFLQYYTALLYVCFPMRRVLFLEHRHTTAVPPVPRCRKLRPRCVGRSCESARMLMRFITSIQPYVSSLAFQSAAQLGVDQAAKIKGPSDLLVELVGPSVATPKWRIESNSRECRGIG